MPLCKMQKKVKYKMQWFLTFIARVNSSKICWSLIPQSFQRMMCLLLQPRNWIFFLNLINPTNCQQHHHLHQDLFFKMQRSFGIELVTSAENAERVGKTKSHTLRQAFQAVEGIQDSVLLLLLHAAAAATNTPCIAPSKSFWALHSLLPRPASTLVCPTALIWRASNTHLDKWVVVQQLGFPAILLEREPPIR